MTPLPQDTANHIVVNTAAVTIVASTAALVGLSLPICAALGVAAAITVSVWKEWVHDKLQRKGTPSWKDMAANAAGMVLGLAPWLVVYGVFLPSAV